MAAIGLRTASSEDIAALKCKYPNGVHVVKKLNGDMLPFNGVFYTHKSITLNKWATHKYATY